MVNKLLDLGNGQVLLVNILGTFTVSSLAFGDGDTGFFEAADDALSLISGGEEGVRITEADSRILINIKGGIERKITDVNTKTYDLVLNDDILLVTYTGTGAGTSLTLPSAQTTKGRTIVIKDVGSGGIGAGTNNITIDTEDSKTTIDGAARYVISTDYDKVTLTSDGTNWFTI